MLFIDIFVLLYYNKGNNLQYYAGILCVENKGVSLMNEYSEKKRIFSVDFACIIGLILMLGLHFFERSGVQEIPFASGVAAIGSHTLRWLCMTGYPLVLMVNGAAFLREDFSFSQYKGFFKLIYCVVLGYFAVKYLGGADVGAMNSSVPFYHYDGIQFAELYAVILLATPFLNCAYQGLPSNKARFRLIIVMCLITSVPDMLIIDDIRILPTIFSSLYPVTLYFIGAYIYDNRERMDVLSSVVLLISLCLAQGIFSYNDSVHLNGGAFCCPRLDSYSSLGVIVSAGALFAMVCNVNIKNQKVSLVFRELARCAMLIIMLSGYAENKVLKTIMGDMDDLSYMKYFPLYLCIIVVIMFAGSLVFLSPFSLVRVLIIKNNEQSDVEMLDEFFAPEQNGENEKIYYRPESVHHPKKKRRAEPIEEKKQPVEEENASETVKEYQPKKSHRAEPVEENIQPVAEEEKASEPEEIEQPKRETEAETADLPPKQEAFEEIPIYAREKKREPKQRKNTTFDSVMSEYSKDFHSTTPPDDVDKLIEFIMSGK